MSNLRSHKWTRSWVIEKVSLIRCGFHYNQHIKETETRFRGTVLAHGDGTIVNEGIHYLAFYICLHLENMSQKICIPIAYSKTRRSYCICNIPKVIFKLCEISMAFSCMIFNIFCVLYICTKIKERKYLKIHVFSIIR